MADDNCKDIRVGCMELCITDSLPSKTTSLGGRDFTWKPWRLSLSGLAVGIINSDDGRSHHDINPHPSRYANPLQCGTVQVLVGFTDSYLFFCLHVASPYRSQAAPKSPCFFSAWSARALVCWGSLSRRSWACFRSSLKWTTKPVSSTTHVTEGRFCPVR